MILLRVTGRFIRTERLFIEDRIAALALIPLILRMVCVHYILKFGTNNADFSGLQLSTEQLHQKSIASGLVLLSRFFYAATYDYASRLLFNYYFEDFNKDFGRLTFLT